MPFYIGLTWRTVGWLVVGGLVVGLVVGFLARARVRLTVVTSHTVG